MDFFEAQERARKRTKRLVFLFAFAVLGTVLLKEKFGLQRAIGTGVIVAGVMALRLG